MTNIFRPIDGTKVLPERIQQGKPWKNISFGRNASIEDYQKKGLYLEVADKPKISKYQTIHKVGEVIDHTNKTVTIQWEVSDLPLDRVAQINEMDAKEEEKRTGTLANVTIAQGEAWIESTVTDLGSAKLALKKLLRLILSRT